MSDAPKTKIEGIKVVNNKGQTTNIPGMMSMASLSGCAGDDCAKFFR